MVVNSLVHHSWFWHSNTEGRWNGLCVCFEEKNYDADFAKNKENTVKGLAAPKGQATVVDAAATLRLCPSAS